METVYIIGPLTTHGDLATNIEYAEKLAAVLMARGKAPIWTHSLARVPMAVGAIPPGVALWACEHLALRASAEGSVAIIAGASESEGCRQEWQTVLADLWLDLDLEAPTGKVRLRDVHREAVTFTLLEAVGDLGHMWTHEAIDAAWAEIVRGTSAEVAQ